MRVRVVLGLILASVMVAVVLPVVSLPGMGPRPVPTRVQTLPLAEIAPAAGRGMSGVEQPTASRSGVVQTDPFGLVGLTWDAPPPEGSVVKVRVREEQGWTSWLPLPWDEHNHHGPDPGTEEAAQSLAGTDPMLTGESDAVQVWVQTPDGQAPPNTRIHLVATDDVDVQQTPMAQAAAAPGQPQIITRAQWGADESMRNRGPLYSSVVKVGFVHHTVTSSSYSPEQAAGQVRNLYAYFTKAMKYSDMAYNFLVDRFGRLYEGRYGGMDRPVIGGHTAGLNNDSFAVSAMGNFDEYDPPDSQMSPMKESIAQLLAWKLGLSDRDPAGKDTLVSTGSLNSGFWDKDETATLNRVSGHRDAGNTACPGRYLYAEVPSIRARAAEIYAKGGGSSQTPDVPDLITPNPVTDEFNFRGSGNGDGVGLPKAGVLGQARGGATAGAILGHYLSGVEVGQAEDSKVIRVALGSPRRAVLDSQALRAGGGDFRIAGLRGGAATTARVTASGSTVLVERQSGKRWTRVATVPKASLRWAGTRNAGKLGTAATAMRIGPDVLRQGSVSVTAVDGRLRLIAGLRVADEYLPYLWLVPRTWPDQAQRTMAIVARSRALAAVYDPACGCHLSDEGLAGQRATTQKGYGNWRKAVDGTAGTTVSHQGAVLDVPVFDSTGGATLNAADVWGKDVPWLTSAEDPWSLKPRNTAYATWDQQTRAQTAVAELFGLPDVARLDLRTRMTGGAVATAVATSSSGQTATISGEKLRVGLDLPSAFIARSVDPAPVTATALSASLGAGRGAPVVVQASDTAVVALAAAFAGAQDRPLFLVGGSGPSDPVRKALRSRTMTAVGPFGPASLRALQRAGSVRRVTADSTQALSLRLAQAGAQKQRRTVVVAPVGNPAAMASAAMAAARARGHLLAVDATPGADVERFTKEHASRTIVVAGSKEIPDAAAAALRRPSRLRAQDPVVRAARLAALGPRQGEAILVGVDRPMAAAAAAASRRPVLLVAPKSGNRSALQFVQSSPAIAVLRSVGADPSAVAQLRRA